ncbi:MATE family efflux transporter [Staphylococcus hominis]|uniref:hypothetical protein n=1 Tax=Staphylococcus hominis TaxID=1290 RepID=UPI002D7E89C6|nr:hypothetical protein [Staphylococcus hominis]
MLWFSQIITIVLNFSVQVILANNYSIEDTGVYFIVIYLMNLFSTICLFGINNYYIYRNATENKFNKHEIFNLVKIYLILNLIFWTLFNVIGIILYPSYKLFILSSSLLMAITSFLAILSSIYQIKNEIKNISLIQIIIPTIKVSALVFGIFVLNKYLYGYSIFSIALILICMIVIYKQNESIRKYIKLEKNTRELTLSQLLRVLAPYAFLNVFFLLYTQGNTLLLGIISKPESAALFGIAYLILNTFFIFPTAIFQKVLAHKLIYKMYDNEMHFKVIIKYLVELLILLSVIIILVMFLCSSAFIVYVFGETYERSVNLLNYLILIIPFRLVTILLGNILNTDEYIYMRIKVELFITILNVSLNIILINFIGIFGAVIAVIITEILLCIFYLKVIHKLFGVYINKLIFLTLAPLYLVILLNMNFNIAIVIQILIIIILLKFIRRRINILWKQM